MLSASTAGLCFRVAQPSVRTCMHAWAEIGYFSTGFSSTSSFSKVNAVMINWQCLDAAGVLFGRFSEG